MATTINYTVTMGTTIIYMAIIFYFQVGCLTELQRTFWIIRKSKTQE